MFLFIPRSLCALKRITAKGDSRYSATQGIRIALAKGMYRAEATDGHRAIVVQGTVPTSEPPWPAFKEVPDDVFEAIIMPKDLERACKVGDDYLQSCFGLVGIAISIQTGNMAGEHHASADEFIKLVHQLAGGARDTKSTREHHHLHHHQNHEHHH